MKKIFRPNTHPPNNHLTKGATLLRKSHHRPPASRRHNLDTPIRAKRRVGVKKQSINSVSERHYLKDMLITDNHKTYFPKLKATMSDDFRTGDTSSIASSISIPCGGVVAPLMAAGFTPLPSR